MRICECESHRADVSVIVMATEKQQMVELSPPPPPDTRGVTQTGGRGLARQSSLLQLTEEHCENIWWWCVTIKM